MKRAVLVIAVLATAVIGLPAYGSDFPEAMDKPLYFELGGISSSFDTQAGLQYQRSDGLASAGATIDFEQLLDIPVQKTYFRGTGYWRISKRNYIDVGFESINREGRRSLDEDVSWGDVSFAANARIDGKFDNTNAYLGWHYDMFQADNVRFYGGIGFSYTKIKASLTGQGELTRPDGTVQSGSFEKGFEIAAPLPVLALGADGAISRSFTFGMYARALYLNISDFSGGIVEGGLNVKWFATRNLGLVLGVDLTSIRIKKYRRDNETLTASYQFAGPRLAVAIGF